MRGYSKQHDQRAGTARVVSAKYRLCSLASRDGAPKALAAHHASMALQRERRCGCRNCIDSCRVSGYLVGNTGGSLHNRGMAKAAR